jgi:predicted metal-dependent enzyme (double-stranded beta helix superfamily)
MIETAHGVGTLIGRLREAVRLEDPEAITRRVKDELEEMIANGGLALPERFYHARPDSYARRLLHLDEELRFSALVMTWGPGQHTALHDHAGIWCVEGVVEGRMDVERYELVGEEDEEGLCRFEERDKVQAGVGSAGALIPPFDFHVLGNALTDRPSLTLHVYGGEMDHCSIFQPLGGGLWRRQQQRLSYDA